jgi:hypothetical protein
MPFPQPKASPLVPRDVDAKLRVCGEPITDRQWHALPLPARRRLMAAPSETPTERVALAALVRWLLETFPPPARVLTARSQRH